MAVSCCKNSCGRRQPLGTGIWILSEAPAAAPRALAAPRGGRATHGWLWAEPSAGLPVTAAGVSPEQATKCAVPCGPWPGPRL